MSGDERPPSEVTEPVPEPDADRGLCLLVVGGPGGAIVKHPLPPSGTVVIGRSTDADVVIRETWISRRHAALHLGATLELEDLGGSNGTRAHGRRLEPGERVTVVPGEVIELAQTMVLVQRDRRRPRPPADAERDDGPDLLVRDPRMRQLLRLLERVAPGDLPVLLVGETGTGKEVLADALHRFSPRRDRPMLRLNCAALPEGLVESELFGHERGAFTGAAAAQVGMLEAASGGTLFLDEVGELPLAIQSKLLRALEDGSVRRVGGQRACPIDVRFVAATNRDLEAEITAGRFRQDLYYRLNGVVVSIPPLRDRPTEIEPLAAQFCARAARVAGRATVPALAPDAIEWLHRHPWPGNIRELRNTMERAVLLAEGDVISAALLRGELAEPGGATPDPHRFRTELAEVERRYLVRALELCDGNRTHAARLLGMSRNTLLARIREHGLGEVGLRKS